jgi:cytochrome c-type biogenesis protein CcmH
MKALALLPVLVLAACTDHQKPPEDVPLGTRPAASPTPATASPGQAIVTGTITIADALKDKVPANATLFIVARPEGMGGPPALVKRVAGATYPYAFRLAADDVMVQGAPVPEKLKVSARVDQDGDAMSRTPGDLSGAAKMAVPKGTSGVELVLDQAVAAAN